MTDEIIKAFAEYWYETGLPGLPDYNSEICMDFIENYNPELL